MKNNIIIKIIILTGILFGISMTIIRTEFDEKNFIDGYSKQVWKISITNPKVYTSCDGSCINVRGFPFKGYNINVLHDDMRWNNPENILNILIYVLISFILVSVLRKGKTGKSDLPE